MPGPWSRLIDEHRENLARLDGAQAEPPPWWGLPLGVIVPWGFFLAAAFSREPGVVRPALAGFAMLVPIGLLLLFLERLQVVAVGFVLGMATSLFVALVVFGGG